MLYLKSDLRQNWSLIWGIEVPDPVACSIIRLVHIARATILRVWLDFDGELPSRPEIIEKIKVYVYSMYYDYVK